MLRYAIMSSPLGPLTIAGSACGITSISFDAGDAGDAGQIQSHAGEQADTAAFAGVVDQLEQYFAGRRRAFDVALDLAGTDFQLRVWRELMAIPYGTTISYGELARRTGNPQAARAVGAANGKNPVAIIVPCHRVIGSHGTLTGYAGGLDNKRALLALEAGGAGVAGRAPAGQLDLGLA